MTEKKIGDKAALMLQNALRSSAGRFGSHLRGDKHIKDVEAKSRVRNSKRQDGTKQPYLRGVAVVMVRHGFVQHYGIEVGRIRKGSERTRRKPKETKYSFRSHRYSKGMKAQPFIDEAVKNSGAVEYIARELPKVRGEELLVYVKKYLENR